MKRVRFKEEAERLNVPVEAVLKAYQKLVEEGKIYGIINAMECICFAPEEVEDLVNLLASKPVQIKQLAEELRLEREQVCLIIDWLLRKNRIKGWFVQEGLMFISESELKALVIKVAGEIGSVDVDEISKRSLIPKELIYPMIEQLTNQVIEALRPYTQIKLIDFSHEVKLPESLTISLLKRLISAGKITGSLDIVNHILTIERAPKLPIISEKGEILKERRAEEQKTVSRPSRAWYLVPLFLGLIGGLIGYFALKDEDRNMANDLFQLGIAMTILGIVFTFIYLSRLYL